MKFPIRSLTLWSALAFGGIAYADAPKAIVAEPEKVGVGDIVELDASASTGDVFHWEMLSNKKLIPADGGKRAYFASGQPGRFKFLFVVAGVVDGKAAVETQRVVVEVLPAQPGPGPVPPGPEPAPPPQPTPTPVVAGHLFVTYVMDASAQGQAALEQARLKTSVPIRAALPALDAEWRSYNSDEPELVRTNLIAYVTQAGPPVVFVQSADGKIVATIDDPTDVDVIATVKRLRGQP